MSNQADEGDDGITASQADSQTDLAGGLPPLTDAELRIAREDLGLTAEWLANHLGVTLRTVRRWEHGHSPVPEGVAAAVGTLTDEADRRVAEAVARLLPDDDSMLRIPRGDLDGWPAGWWRALAARVIEEVPGLRTVYIDASD